MLNNILVFTLIAALAAIFYIYPSLDFDSSSMFYRNVSGFYLQDNLLVFMIYKSAPVICGIFVLVASIRAFSTFRKHKSFHAKYYKKIIYVTLVCLIGPGLLVHTALKDQMGRPRPREIVEFGGEKHYQRIFIKSNECNTNCSFPSGHASVGFMFFSLAFLYKGRTRLAISAASVFLGFLIGSVRIIQGAQFLSDVVFSGIVVYLTAYVLYLIMKPDEAAQ